MSQSFSMKTRFMPESAYYPELLATFARFRLLLFIIIKQILAQVKQIIVTYALCYQLPERNITVFKRL